MSLGADQGVYYYEPIFLIALYNCHLGRDDGNLGVAFLVGIGGTTGFRPSGGNTASLVPGTGLVC